MSTQHVRNQYDMPNPLTQYLQPEFPDPLQTAAGIDQDMTPRPTGRLRAALCAAGVPGVELHHR